MNTYYFINIMFIVFFFTLFTLRVDEEQLI